MSKTPWTDEQILHHDNGNGHPSDFVFASFARQLEAELADKEKQLAEITCQRNAYKKALEISEDELMTARAEIENLRFMVHNQRCCRNCGNHANWNFDTCGFGENPKDENEGPHCRRNDLKRWRAMEYRRAKEERGE